MPLTPTHRRRTPYLFHFDGQTVALGEADYLHRINDRLTEAGYITRPTYWDQVYLADENASYPEQLGGPAGHMSEIGEPDQLNSVGVTCGSVEFWSAMYARSFEHAPWSGEGDTLYMPQLPDWLDGARSWVFDPIAPIEGPGEPDSAGGWVRVRETEGAGQPLGLFQLTSPDYVWVFGSAADLQQVTRLAHDLGRDLAGFDQACGYLGYDLTCSSIRLPVECALPLQEHLFLAGVDVETLLWGES
ncbi:hypothetical protein A7979_10540 [Rothia nasimurium]|uniref:Uncharacterized protein n=1 Tax=Rothia nasimurium TaxID=85336 RepID=A0A1Y1RRH6_9MICC|nr:hypothetical protein [Rothia nasimurium]ORC22805.1 hypothetical protein A7979_10540 [Rothia nasimurium]